MINKTIITLIYIVFMLQQAFAKDISNWNRKPSDEFEQNSISFSPISLMENSEKSEYMINQLKNKSFIQIKYEELETYCQSCKEENICTKNHNIYYVRHLVRSGSGPLNFYRFNDEIKISFFSRGRGNLQKSTLILCLDFNLSDVYTESPQGNLFGF